jgi:hypothetical protein
MRNGRNPTVREGALRCVMLHPPSRSGFCLTVGFAYGGDAPKALRNFCVNIGSMPSSRT